MGQRAQDAGDPLTATHHGRLTYETGRVSSR